MRSRERALPAPRAAVRHTGRMSPQFQFGESAGNAIGAADPAAGTERAPSGLARWFGGPDVASL